MTDEANYIDNEDLIEILQDGDIIFQTSNSSQSKAIQIATKSDYSHMGIIYRIENKLFVYEAIQPVKLTPFLDWVERGNKGKFVVKRLKKADELMTPAVKKKMKLSGEQYLGKNYDLYFEWSDERIYCSELVWKIYKNSLDIEIGKLERLQDFDLAAKEVKQKLTERYGKNIPKDELVISPASMFNSEELYTVYKQN
jgi:uncharacterized protein YycO